MIRGRQVPHATGKYRENPSRLYVLSGGGSVRPSIRGVAGWGGLAQKTAAAEFP